jgi:hypothetical protein
MNYRTEPSRRATDSPSVAIGVVVNVVRTDGGEQTDDGLASAIKYTVKVVLPATGSIDVVMTPAVPRWPAPIEVRPFRAGDYVVCAYTPDGLGSGGVVRMMTAEGPAFGPCEGEAGAVLSDGEMAARGDSVAATLVMANPDVLRFVAEKLEKAKQ